jgi:hypothetical protein
MSKSAFSSPKLHALIIAHKEVISRIRATEKTIETKSQLLKDRKKKIATIDRRINLINKMAPPSGTLYSFSSSQFDRDKRKLTIQIKADQTTIETKLRVVTELKELLVGIEKQIQTVKEISSREREYLVRGDLKVNTKFVNYSHKSRKSKKRGV